MSQPSLDIPDLPGQLGELLKQIPSGNVTTYGSLADALGNRIAARWVGHFMMHHEHCGDCTCHRVIRANGQIGEYIVGRKGAKARRLRAEGVTVRKDTVDPRRFGFDSFVSGRPLESLQRVQEDLVGKVLIRSRRRLPKLIGGLDVSYPTPDRGVAAYALVELDTGRLVWSTTVGRRIVFPYISSYLAFRELPILVDLVDEVRRLGKLADVVLVDGSGILHQRRAGVASHLGVVASLPTIGVTKKLLCGEVDIEGLQPMQPRPVVLDNRLIGAAIRPTSGSKRPIFVSPGHRVNLAFSENVVTRLLIGRRLPEPLYWADRLSRQAGRNQP